MKDLFTIGEVALLFNLNIQTLRYYDKIGLVKPEKTDLNNHYRLYSTKQFERLNTIKYLRALGMSIKDIANFFENKDLTTMTYLLENQREKVRNQKAKLDLIERKIEHRLNDLYSTIHSPINQIELKELPPRKIAILKQKIDLLDDLEYPLRTLEKNSHFDSVIFLGKVGVSVPKQHLIQQSFDGFSAIFVILESEDTCDCPTSLIAGGSYLTLRFCGTHKEAHTNYAKLLDYIHKHAFMIVGDAIEMTMIDSGMTNDPSQYLTELQIPVKKA